MLILKRIDDKVPLNYAPQPGHPGDGAADVRAYLVGRTDLTYKQDVEACWSQPWCKNLPDLPFLLIYPNESKIIDTGIRIAQCHPIPTLKELGFIEIVFGIPRSSACKTRVTLGNSPGFIDAETYRGPIKVGLINLGTEPFVVQEGQRIAQLYDSYVFDPEQAFKLDDTAEVDETVRGSGGFGSTGHF